MLKEITKLIDDLKKQIKELRAKSKEGNIQARRDLKKVSAQLKKLADFCQLDQYSPDNFVAFCTRYQAQNSAEDRSSQ